jgi:hypothetical protein
MRLSRTRAETSHGHIVSTCTRHSGGASSRLRERGYGYGANQLWTLTKQSDHATEVEENMGRLGSPDVYMDILQSWQDTEHTFLFRVSIYFVDDRYIRPYLDRSWLAGHLHFSKTPAASYSQPFFSTGWLQPVANLSMPHCGVTSHAGLLWFATVKSNGPTKETPTTTSRGPWTKTRVFLLTKIVDWCMRRHWAPFLQLQHLQQVL